MGTPKLPDHPLFDALLQECREKKHQFENQLPKSGLLEEYRKVVANSMSNAIVKNFSESLVAELVNAVLSYKPREVRQPVDPIDRALKILHKNATGRQLDGFAGLKGTAGATEQVKHAVSFDDLKSSYQQALEDMRSSTARAAASGTSFHTSTPTH
jgi:hypothetical protein